MADVETDTLQLVDDYAERRLDRRGLLRAAALLGISASASRALLGNAEVARAATAKGTTQRTLRIGYSYDDLAPMDPALTSVYGLADSLYEGLVTHKPGTFEIVNALAEKITVSKDEKRINFTLKKGIHFHKGFGEVTAEDVKYSFERHTGIQPLYPGSKTGSSYAGDWTPLVGVQVTGKYSGVIKLKHPFAPLFRTTLPREGGLIVSKKAVEKYGEHDFPTHPIGTGPYELTRYAPRGDGTLSRFHQYGGASAQYWPKYDWETLQFFRTPLNSPVTIPFQAGALDAIGGGALPIDQTVLSLVNSGKYRVASRQALDYYFLSMNIHHPNLQDIRVRQAIRSAIDVPAVIQVAWSGVALQAHAIIPPNMGVGYWKDAPRYNRDVAKAKALISAAGANGRTIQLLSNGSTQVGEVIQANLADIGLNIEIIPPNSTPTDWYTNKDLNQLTYTGYGTAPDPNWSLEWFTCNQVGVWNLPFACDNQFDQLFAQGGETLDEAKRTQIYIRMQQRMDRYVGFVWFYFPTYYFLSPKHIKPAATPDGWMLPRYYKAV